MKKIFAVAAATMGCFGALADTWTDSSTGIGDHAFRGCSNLTSVTIGSGITPTDLVTLGSRAYTTQTFGGKKVRRYRDLVYGARDDASGEGASYAGAEGAYNRHRSGNYYDVFIAESFLNSPEALADMPVFIYLHGGSWSEKYDKDGSNGDFLGRVATNGYVAITMDYQLQSEMSMTGGRFTPRGKASFAAMLCDIDTMLTYLKAQLPTIGMTNTRVVIGGDSAGAHLSMCYAWDQNGPNRLSGVSLRHDLAISCVVSIVGPSDLAAIFGPQLAMIASLPPESRAMMAASLDFFGALAGADLSGMLARGETAAMSAALAAWSPVGLVDSKSCRAILAYGYTNATVTASASDGVVPISNYNALTNAFAASGVSYDARLFNKDHGSLSGGSEPSATWIVEKLGALRLRLPRQDVLQEQYRDTRNELTPHDRWKMCNYPITSTQYPISNYGGGYIGCWLLDTGYLHIG